MRGFVRVSGWTIMVLTLLGGLLIVLNGCSQLNYDEGAAFFVVAIGWGSILSGIFFGGVLIMLANIDERLQSLALGPATRQSAGFAVTPSAAAPLTATPAGPGTGERLMDKPSAKSLFKEGG